MENENEDLEDLLGRLKKETEAKNEEIKWLKTLVNHRESQIRSKAFTPSEQKSTFPKIAIVSITCLVVAAAGFAAYSLFSGNTNFRAASTSPKENTLADRAVNYADSARKANEKDLERIKNNQLEIDSMMRLESLRQDSIADAKNAADEIKKQQSASQQTAPENTPADAARKTLAANTAANKAEVKPKEEPVDKAKTAVRAEPKPVPKREATIAKKETKKPAAKPAVAKKLPAKAQVTKKPQVNRPEPEEDFKDEAPVVVRDKYALAVTKAYFYSKPDVSAKAPAVLLNSGNMELTAVEEINGFVRVSFFNTQGSITEGWLRRQDLQKIN